MAVVIRVKGRTGSSGAPSSLKTGEIAFNHVDKIFYIGVGDDGGGNALTIESIAGSEFAKLASPEFTGIPLAPTAGAGTNTTQLATTAFVQTAVNNAVQGLDPKESVKAASTDNITLSGEQSVDGVSLVDGDRILIKNQTSASENGIYVVSTGAWSRATDLDSWDEIPGAFVFVEQGTTNADIGYVCTSDQGGTLDTTDITFTQFTGTGAIVAGTGLTKTGDTLNVETASSARIVVNVDNIDLATTAVTPGTYQGVTVDAYGRITAASDQGYIGGTTGATDNAILRADGTGGKTSQTSTVTIDDSGNMSGATLDGGTY